MRPGFIPPLICPQCGVTARAESKAVVVETLRAEIAVLRTELGALRAAACRAVDARENTPPWPAYPDGLFAALDQLTYAITAEPRDTDELAASMARHPAGKGRRP